MSFWLVSVPAKAVSAGKSVVSELQGATQGMATTHAFDLPALKVGTLDQLMALSEDTTKMDTFVGGVAKKIEKTYYEMWKAEAVEQAQAKERAAVAAGLPQAASSAAAKEEKAPELRIGDQQKTAHEFVVGWQWNDVRYPRRSPLRTLAELITKDASKADEALKKQVAEFGDVRTQHTALERRDAGSLLVKPLGAYVSSQPLETANMTTLMLVVPRARKQEFLDTYEQLEPMAAAKEAEEAAKKQKEAQERAAKEEERRRAEEAVAAAQPSAASAARESERAKAAAEAAAKAAEAKQLEAELAGPGSAQQEQARKEKEEEEKRKNKKLPAGCNAVVPRSATLLCDVANEEFVLYSVVVLRQGAEHYKNLCRERRFVVRPFKFDPAEDAAEKERKEALAAKKKKLWNFLIRWCSTTYSEIFTAWMHLKAVRLYVESVLRYGLPFNAQAALIEPGRGKERQLRDVLRQLYAQRLAGSNAALATQLDPNEPDISGLGAEFYPYVSLNLVLSD